ncbi:tetratricopeptide repeat protein [Tenacibaculum sp. S7007]|uniref:Tetratricopeptide repeat protein n=1 Tax=Tenacibaculum pelagium TaxID=2759527 RepID=A0A839ANL8_9FLAO|nr:tetratricopeptide repeat protein [Tenacibaculum pelagium]MBA6156087.1 tetratricopeptide repeat protein [Tenacibaculum pelagium]
MYSIKKLTVYLMAAIMFILTACQAPQTKKTFYPENEIPFESTSNEAMQEFLTGLNIFDQGNGQKAKPFFDKALALDPNFVSAQMYRAFSSNSAKDFSKNRDKFLALRSTANEGEAMLMDLLMANMENDDVKELELSKKLVEKYPSSARAYDYLANSYASLDKVEKSRENWKKAIGLNSDFLPAISNLGASYLFTSPKDFKEAEKYMERVVEKVPQSSRAQINLGDCYRAQNDLEKALKSYIKAAELDPTDAVAFSKAGHANSFLGNFDAARKNFQDARAVSEFGLNSYNFEAFTYLYEEDPKKALAFLENAAQAVSQMDIPESNKTGTKMNCAFNCAMIAMHHGDVEHLKEVVEMMKPLFNQFGKDIGSKGAITNQKVNALYWDAIASAAAENYEEALAKAEIIKSTLATINDPNKLRPYHRVLAFVNYKQENYDKALEYAAKLNPDNVYDRYWMAKANKMAGNNDVAMDMFNEIADYNFNSIGYALVRNEVKKMLASNE